MKMKMPDNTIGGSSSNSYNHANFNAAVVTLNQNVGRGGGDGDGNANNGPAYYSDPYESDAESISTPPTEDNSEPAGDDFAEYMWMENEDEFDEQEMQRLEEEELMDQCIEAMMQDELAAAERMAAAALMGNVPRESGLMNILSSLQLDKEHQQQQLLALQPRNVNVEKSTLNPLAAEFVPSLRPLVAPIPY
ncbi:polyadenylate-binding protein-interacting protein 2B [Anopheles darlingi]|uniref:polyadenylate-binding protein-interacting protein 2B n=1 Tax=Anopheles darlingi TaxID=43151 RepID=UPI0020FFFD94|nr:polyadenylate-binding protein-interacting protein 2B [Anopheles darlingi]XP_049530852.1 polyadenylate-binding protein-interacting protein 2B [Anopheles darlingi]XP_049530853.1 polyadenylate-binding protein-interacting protein 2B [Anopheles darlingi]